MPCHVCRAEPAPHFGRCLYCETPVDWCAKCLEHRACSACLEKMYSPDLPFVHQPYRKVTQRCAPKVMGLTPEVVSVTATRKRPWPWTWDAAYVSAHHPTPQENYTIDDGTLKRPPLRIFSIDEPVQLTIKVAPPQLSDIFYKIIMVEGAAPLIETTGELTATLRPQGSGVCVILICLDVNQDGQWTPDIGKTDRTSVALVVAIHDPPPIDGLPHQRVLCAESTATNNGFFYLSNENDWRGIDPDAPQCDAVISFSNNVGWDQALECGAKVLVLWDWQAAPLVAQEQIFRPLILASATPAEFLSRVCGERLSGVDTDDLTAVCTALMKSAVSRDSKLSEIRAAFHRETLEAVARLELDPQFLAAYYKGIAALRDGSSAELPIPLNAPGGRMISDTRDLALEFLQDLRARYARPSIDSCLSSAGNFLRLQTLFASSVYYVRADIRTSEMFLLAASALRTHSIALNLSNVLHALYDFSEKKDVRFKRDMSFHAGQRCQWIVDALRVGNGATDGPYLRLTLGISGGHEYHGIKLAGTNTGSIVYKRLNEI
jgi:hypothetical protein